MELFRFIPASFNGLMLWVNFLIDLAFFLDLSAKVIFLRTKYIKSPWFLIDLVSTLPIISSATELMGALGPELQSTRVARVARVARMARVARVATAIREVRGGFLKTPADSEDTPAFDRAILITIPLLLAVFMAMSYVITQREVRQLQTHLARQVEAVKTQAEITQLPEHLDPQQPKNQMVDRIILTKIIDGRRVKFAFSTDTAQRQADLIQGLMLVFVLLTSASVVYMSQSYAADQTEEEEESLLGQFLSPAIVDKINSNPEVLERFYSRWLSVFFVAISGFTHAIEAEFEDLEALALRRRQVMDIVRQQTVVVQQGILDKFMGDTVMGWIGGPFSTYWDRLAMFRERLALDELEYAEQDIRSIHRAIHLIETNGHTGLSDETTPGLPSSGEARLAYLKEALSEAEGNRNQLLEKVTGGCAAPHV